MFTKRVTISQPPGVARCHDSQELFVAPRHGVAIKGGADLTLTGSGFVYPAAARALWDYWGLGLGKRLDELRNLVISYRACMDFHQQTR